MPVVKHFFVGLESRSFSPTAKSKSAYKKPLLRKISPEEHQGAQEMMQEFLARMKVIGKNPRQENFEAYVKSGRQSAN